MREIRHSELLCHWFSRSHVLSACDDPCAELFLEQVALDGSAGFLAAPRTPTVEDCHSGWLSRLDGTLEALCNNERKVQIAEMPCYY